MNEERRKKIIELFERNGLLLNQRITILDLYKGLKENKERIAELEMEITGKNVTEQHKIEIEL